MAIESQTLGLFMAGPKSVLEMVHISKAEIADLTHFMWICKMVVGLGPHFC